MHVLISDNKNELVKENNGLVKKKWISTKKKTD